MYESLHEAHSVRVVDHTYTSSSATAFARNFIRASWEENIHKAEWDLYLRLIKDDEEHREYQEVGVRAMSSDQQNWDAMWYQEMIRMRRELNDRRKKVKNITSHTFVAEDIEPRVVEKFRETAELALNRERRSWVRLIDKLATMEATISNHMGEYSQRAALEESFGTNRQTRSAGQLTKIATVIVPCTFDRLCGG